MRDTDYLDWAERPRWTRAEAASLLNGKNPQQDDPDLVPFADLPSSMDPAAWIGAAGLAGMQVDQAWEVLFPDSIPESLASILGEEPDHRQFVAHYVKNSELPLGELVRFALPPGHEHDYEEVLRRTHGELPAEKKASRVEDLASVMTSPRRFLETYPPGLPLDARCDELRLLLAEHRQLSDWLEGKPIRLVSGVDPELQNLANGVAVDLEEKWGRKPTKPEAAKELRDKGLSDLPLSTIVRRISSRPWKRQG